MARTIARKAIAIVGALALAASLQSSAEAYVSGNPLITGITCVDSGGSSLNVQVTWDPNAGKPLYVFISNGATNDGITGAIKLGHTQIASRSFVYVNNGWLRGMQVYASLRTRSGLFDNGTRIFATCPS